MQRSLSQSIKPGSVLVPLRGDLKLYCLILQREGWEKGCKQIHNFHPVLRSLLVAAALAPAAVAILLVTLTLVVISLLESTKLLAVADYCSVAASAE